MTTRLFPATHNNPLNFFSDEALRMPDGLFFSATGVIDITTTPQTAFDIKFRSRQKDVADKVGLTLPIGAVITRVALRTFAPNADNRSDLRGQTVICTAGNRLKLATAVGATGTQAFDAAAATAYVATAAFGANSIPAAQSIFGVPPNGVSARLTAPAAFRVFVDNGTTGVGSPLSVNTGSLQYVAQVNWWEPDSVPTVEEILGRPVPPA